MSRGRGEFGSSYGAVNEYHDDPGNRPASGRYQDSDYTDFDAQCATISSNVFKIDNGAQSIDRSLKQIGTNSDSTQLRDKIHSTSQSTSNIVNETIQLLKRLTTTKQTDRVKRMQVDRLKTQFQEAVQRFTKLQKNAADKVRAIPPAQKLKPAVNWDDNDDYMGKENQDLLAEQDERRMQQLQEQDQVVDDDLELIREREDRIHQLEADILDVNEIFRDLGTMIQEQGVVINTIEENVESAYSNVDAGRTELEKAAKYQKKSRKKICILLIILAVVLAIVGIILAVTLS